MTTPTMTVPSGRAVQSRPVPWAEPRLGDAGQHRGLFVGLGVLLGLIAAYLVVMAITQDKMPTPPVAACHPANCGHVLHRQELKNAFISDYWGGDNSVPQSGGAQTVSSLMLAVPVLLGALLDGCTAAFPRDGERDVQVRVDAGRRLHPGGRSAHWWPRARDDRRDRGVHRGLLLVLPAVPWALGQVSEMLPLSFALLGVAFAAWTLGSPMRWPRSSAPFSGALVLGDGDRAWVLYVVLAMATATAAIRPHYAAAPVTVPSGGTGNTGASNGWVISDLEKAPNGQVLSRDDLYHYFQGLPSSVQNSAESPMRSPPG